MNAKQWCMIVHFSIFAGYIVAIAGFIAPIIIWQMKKDEFPEVDAHGKVVANWLLSALIYGVVSALLVFIFIGIPMLVALGVVGIVFPIIGGIKANDGILWKYPLSIEFLK